MSAATGKDSIKAVWLERLSSALRTALACTIVGCTTLYGPARLRHFLAYPAYSYVTAILIVSDATLGDTLRGCWHALYGTIQVMIPCILTFQMIRPARFSNALAAVAVAVTTFMVALPESTPLMAKRIAFGQAVIVFVGAAIHGAEEGVVTHPIHVASSTALGALASVLAMLFPYPRLAYCKGVSDCFLSTSTVRKHDEDGCFLSQLSCLCIFMASDGILCFMLKSVDFRTDNSYSYCAQAGRFALYPEALRKYISLKLFFRDGCARKTCRLYVENASERLNIYVEGLTAQNKQAAADLLSRAKFLSVAGAKHLQTIKDTRGGMACEKPQIRKLNPGENLQDIEILMKGVEIALDSCTSFPVSMIDEGIKQALLDMKGKIGLKLQNAKCFAPFDATTAPEAKAGESYVLAPKTGGATQADLPAFFFLYCLELLSGELPVGQNPECNSENTNKTETRDVTSKRDQEKANLRKTWDYSTIKLPNMERWTLATKCSLSLGFAVLFGLIFNKENGYWSGLIIATAFVTERQATFTVTNARVQGTAIGSVYGILCSFIFQRFVDLRLLPLLPWIIFTSFLSHSRMYGQAGGISAVTGALLILGRKNYGPPNEFATARLVEVCIGLTCFIMVEILLQPARAATLAKTEFAWSLRALRDCIDDTSQLCAGQKSALSSSIPALRRKHQEVISRINNLEKFIAAAESEPNFWFLPFDGACYGKLLVSLRKMECLLLFVAIEIETLPQLSDRLQVPIKNYLHPLGEKVGFSLKCIEELMSMKQKISTSHDDIELGKSSPSADVVFGTLSSLDEEEDENSIPQHSKEEANGIETREVAQELKSRLILRIYSLEFCISSLTKETQEIEKQVKELVKWENPESCHSTK
ncbi:hypothetical protein POTOM_025081 [Populus tomentosa]|uniref:Integral membrane bound transporter domain-containing protein n=1 Tax=Populus tomentosa TaxID=118781 RepID=A0A8X8CWU5_POPTO|nr:hypothetical protein POTOM_025081 [Populus tomentosa]